MDNSEMLKLLNGLKSAGLTTLADLPKDEALVQRYEFLREKERHLYSRTTDVVTEGLIAGDIADLVESGNNELNRDRAAALFAVQSLYVMAVEDAVRTLRRNIERGLGILSPTTGRIPDFFDYEYAKALAGRFVSEFVSEAKDRPVTDEDLDKSIQAAFDGVLREAKSEDEREAAGLPGESTDEAETEDLSQPLCELCGHHHKGALTLQESTQVYSDSKEEEDDKEDYDDDWDDLGDSEEKR